MKKILIIYAHPSPHKSRYNRSLVNSARLLPNVVIHDLYERYPSLHIDEEFEQKALRDCDVLVFQFPMFWYSAPAILKEWQDCVLQRGFAYGDEAATLTGKTFMIATSTGGSQQMYHQNETHGADISNYLLPMEMAARFCGMQVALPFITHEARRLENDHIRERTTEFCQLLESLTNRDASNG
jgi:putative NADPH-quinone reductase